MMMDIEYQEEEDPLKEVTRHFHERETNEILIVLVCFSLSLYLGTYFQMNYTFAISLSMALSFFFGLQYLYFVHQGASDG